MTEEVQTYSMPFGCVDVGHKVILKDFGFDEPLIVLKAYRGRPIPQDTLPGQYNLSNVDPRNERRNFSEEQLEEEHADDMTLIVARKSGDKGIVVYIPDAEKEVEIYDDEPVAW